LHPGFLEVDRAKEEIEARRQAQGDLEREEVPWVLWAVALVVTVGGVWVGAGRPRPGSRGASVR